MNNFLSLLFIATVLFFTVSSCSIQQKKSEPNTTITSLMEREVYKKGAKSWITSKDRYFSIESPFSQQIEIKAYHSYYYVLIPFGATVPLECFIYKNRLDSATTLVNLVEEAMGKAENIGYEFSSFAAHEYLGNPYLKAEISFLNRNKEIGLLKIIVGQKENNGVVCLHNELGYKATFLRIVSELLHSIKFLEIGPLSDYRQKEIFIIYLNQKNIGFVETYHLKSEDGNDLTESFSSMMVSRSAEQQIAADSVSVESSIKSGVLGKGYYSSSQNGDAAMVLHLSSEAELEKKYKVSGAFGGKEIEKFFEVENDLLTKRAVEKMLIHHFIVNKKKEDLLISSYQPDLNPIQGIQWKYHLVSSVGNQVRLQASSSAIQMDLILDLKGTDILEFKMGRIRLKQERVFYDQP